MTTQTNRTYSTAQIRGYWKRDHGIGTEGLAMLLWCIEQSGPTNKNTDPLLHFVHEAEKRGNDAAVNLVKKIHRHVTYGYAVVKDTGAKPHSTGLKVKRANDCGFNAAEMDLLRGVVKAGNLGLNNRKQLLDAIGIVTVTAEFDAEKYAHNVAMKALKENVGIETLIAKIQAEYKAEKAKAASK